MSMTQDEMKKAVAAAAIDYVEAGTVVGIGTGSTANYFIDELAKIKHKVECTVASSVASADRLKSHGILVEDDPFFHQRRRIPLLAHQQPLRVRPPPGRRLAKSAGQYPRA